MELQFDWQSIAGAVAPIAPKLGAVLGTALGNAAFPGLGGVIGSSVGSLAGSAIAAKLGVEATPQAVGQAIAEDPKAADKLEQLEAERGDEIAAQAQVEIERIRAQLGEVQAGEETSRTSIGAVNETMRAEVQARINDKSMSFFYSGWRPLAGHILNLLVVAIGACIVVAMVTAITTGKADVLTLILNSLLAISAFLAIPGSVVGVTAWGRSFEIGKAAAPAPMASTTAVVPTPIAAPAPDVASIVAATVKALGKRR